MGGARRASPATQDAFLRGPLEVHFLTQDLPEAKRRVEGWLDDGWLELPFRVPGSITPSFYEPDGPLRQHSHVLRRCLPRPDV